MIEITGGGSESVTVGAANAMDIGAVSGGAALTARNNENSKFGVGVAGTLAINLIDTKTIAEVKNSTVTGARNVDIYSLMGGEQFSVAAGLSANISSDQSKAGTVAGSVSVSIVANETKAAITDSTVEGKEGGSPGDVDVRRVRSVPPRNGGRSAHGRWESGFGRGLYLRRDRQHHRGKH